MHATAPPPGTVYRSSKSGRTADGSPKTSAAAASTPAQRPAQPSRDAATTGG
ncbi:hypothetical protein [Ralstonia solanacearum]|uniref:hypothetical protein n=1 Tax=Ralstonia solanacearum TaxID=305 RepID=UPI0013DDBD62|nr:hypothetical protein [Ralstonia solanacearum]